MSADHVEFRGPQKGERDCESAARSRGGPAISSVSREKLDLGDPPIVKIDTPDQAREFVASSPNKNRTW